MMRGFLVGLTLFCAGTSAQAAVYTPSFNGPGLDPSLVTSFDTSRNAITVGFGTMVMSRFAAQGASLALVLPNFTANDVFDAKMTVNSAQIGGSSFSFIANNGYIYGYQIEIFKNKVEVSYNTANSIDLHVLPSLGDISNLEFLQDSQKMTVLINGSSVFSKDLAFVPMTFKFGLFTNSDIEPGYTTTFLSNFSITTPGAPACGVNAPCTGGVPEPSSWALLLAGFGLTGAAMRRRRAVPA